MKPWKNQTCSFCALPLTNLRKTVTKENTGIRLHYDCDRAIERLKAKPANYRVSYDKIRRKLMYINLNRDKTRGNVLVYA